MDKILKILVIDEAHELLLERLSEHAIDYRPEITVDELKTIIHQYDVVVMRTKLRFNEEWIDMATRLKCIARLGSGMDNIAVDYAESKGVVCLNAPEGNKEAVAEQTIGMMINLLANISRSHRGLLKGLWQRTENSGLELGARTVGIIGYGNVGSALAKYLKAFGCRILAYDLYKKDFGDLSIEEVDLDTLKKHADIITLHVPLNEYSYRMIDRSFLESLPRPVFLLNLSRGQVVDTDALVWGLKNGKILGLALDVFEQENLAELSDEQSSNLSYLLGNENVVMTPHIGGLTAESYRKLAEVIADKIQDKFI